MSRRDRTFRWMLLPLGLALTLPAAVNADAQVQWTSHGHSEGPRPVQLSWDSLVRFFDQALRGHEH